MLLNIFWFTDYQNILLLIKGDRDVILQITLKCFDTIQAARQISRTATRQKQFLIMQGD